MQVDQAKVHIASTEEKLAELQTYQGLLVTAASDVKRRHQTALAQNQCLLQLVGRLETCVQVILHVCCCGLHQAYQAGIYVFLALIFTLTKSVTAQAYTAGCTDAYVYT